MKAYSLDFRQKIIQVYEREKPLQRELAKRFGVATSFIIKLLKRHRSGAGLAPKPDAGGKPSQLQAEQLQASKRSVLPSGKPSKASVSKT